MRVLVCGSRTWKDREAIFGALQILHNELVLSTGTFNPEIVVIDGAADGADQLAFECAKVLELKSERYPAEWRKYGKAAGPIRNKQMLDEGKPDLVLAFWDGKSRGTANMVELAKRYGKPVIIHGTKT